MNVKCPRCQIRLRSQIKPQARRLQIVCPACQNRFRVRLADPQLNILIAHEDQAVCRQIEAQVAPLDLMTQVCLTENEILSQLQSTTPRVLLLDVAFNGCFPFQLIENIQKIGCCHCKIVLLPSVYNHAAYKKRPESLYGADAYLELHHIGDRLLPLLTELFPSYTGLLTSAAPVGTKGDERSLQAGDVTGQADKLAKLLVADILLYHQDRLEQGLESGRLDQLFAEQLSEGRRMLETRLPAAVDLPVDFIQQAFEAACQTYYR